LRSNASILVSAFSASSSAANPDGVGFGLRFFRYILGIGRAIDGIGECLGGFDIALISVLIHERLDRLPGALAGQLVQRPYRLAQRIRRGWLIDDRMAGSEIDH
jgi:hypothetical protein